MDRRTFLGTMTAATMLANRLSFAADEHKIEKIGVQLYTVRDQMDKDYEGTLAKVASFGYKEVELAGFDQAADGTVTYFKRSPKEIRAALDAHGLTSPSTHVKYDSLTPEKMPRVIEASETIGNKYMVNPFMDEKLRSNLDNYKRAAETMNKAGDETKKAGIQFAYHNHWFEFLPVDGQMPYDVLLKACDPDLVKMEMDLCWITVGGQDPLKYFKAYPGRFPLVHVKDVKKVPKVSASGGQNFGDSMKDMTEVGSGVIDWKRIFAHSDEAGIKHYFVEHDKPASPFQSIETSYNYLSKLTF